MAAVVLSFGVIELLRQIYSDEKFLELIHRLDKETSGVLISRKKKSCLGRTPETD